MIQLKNVVNSRNPNALLFALNQLKFHDDMRHIVDYLQDNLEEFRKLNDSAAGDLLLHQQGACQFISGLLDKIEDSQEIRHRRSKGE